MKVRGPCYGCYACRSCAQFCSRDCAVLHKCIESEKTKCADCGEWPGEQVSNHIVDAVGGLSACCKCHPQTTSQTPSSSSFKYGLPGSGTFPPQVQPSPPAMAQGAGSGLSRNDMIGRFALPGGELTAGPPTPAGRSEVITDPATLLSMSISRLGASASRISDELDRLRKDILALEWHTVGMDGGEGRAAASKASSGLF